MQNDLTEVKIFEKVLGGYFFLKHPVVLDNFMNNDFMSNG